MHVHTFSIVCTEDGATAEQEPPLSRLKTFKEVITALKDVAYYLEYKVMFCLIITSSTSIMYLYAFLVS